MKYKFNIGEKVYISYCTDDVKTMQDFVGTFMTIEKQTTAVWGTTDDEWPAYRMKEDEGLWYWREDWLSPADNRDIDISATEIFDILKE